MRAVARLMRVLLEYPELAGRIKAPGYLAELPEPGLRLLAKVVKLAQAEPGINAAGIMKSFRDEPAHRHLGALLDRSPPQELAGVTSARDLHGTVDQFARGFRLNWVMHRLAELHEKQVAGGLSEPELERLARLKRERAELNAALRGKSVPDSSS